MEMGQWVMSHGSHGSWVTKDDPFPSLVMLMGPGHSEMLLLFFFIFFSA